MNLFHRVFIISLIFFAACTADPERVAAISNDPFFIDTAGGSCPNLTKDVNNKIVLSWVRNQHDSSSIFCYATSEDGGKTFSQPVIIPGSNNIHSHAENSPKIVFKGSGHVIAIWGTAAHDHRNPYAGVIEYAQSFNNGKSWTSPTRLVNDTSGYDQRYFDVKALSDGEVAIIWLDNRKTTNAQGSALYFAKTKGRNGFTDERLVAEPCCECCRTGLAIDKEDRLHVIYRAIIDDSIRDVVHVTSSDAGKSFTKPARISNDNWVFNGCPHSGPSLAMNDNGMQFVWYTGSTPNGVYYTHSTDNGRTFSPRDTVSGQARHPQIATIRNGNLVTVWDEPFENNGKHFSRIGIEQRSADGKKNYFGFLTGETGFATYPTVIADANNILVAWCEGEKEASRIKVQRVGFKN